MADKNDPKGTEAELRRRAEGRLGEERRTDPLPETEADRLRLLHELQVHQVELEMQNAELVQARDNLAKLLAEYTDLFDFAPVGYVILDPAGTVRRVNLTASTLLGHERGRLTGRRFVDFVAAAARPDFTEFLERAFSGATKQACEMPLVGAGKAQLFVQIEAVPTTAPRQCRIALIDTTELHRAKLDLLKNQKLESLGVLAGGIAHDFNNILTAILGNISLAQAQKQVPDQLSKLLEEAEQAAVRAKTLTKQLLTFAKGGEPVKQVLFLADLLQDATNFAARGSSARCRLVVPDDLWPIEADEGQINRVIHNLVSNAAQAMPAGGEITVSAENVAAAADGGRFVKIRVTDTGCGFPEALQQKIFEPYFSTKLQGSGLGLSVCYSIVRNHGGKIRVASTPGQGTTFQVSLPAADPVEIKQTSATAELAPGGGRILVMDDEAMVRSMAELMLTELGFQAECTQNGAEAIELYRQRMEEGSPFTAVIVDLTVPGGMGGQEALGRMRQIDPQVKAVVSSGYASDPVMANYRDYGFSAVLGKPYRLEEMSKVLRELFGPRA